MSGFEPLDFPGFSRDSEYTGLLAMNNVFISCLKRLRLCLIMLDNSLIIALAGYQVPSHCSLPKIDIRQAKHMAKDERKTFLSFDAKLLAGHWLVERTTYKGLYFVLHSLEISVFLRRRTHPQHHVVLIFDNPPLLRECCSCSFSSSVSGA